MLLITIPKNLHAPPSHHPRRLPPLIGRRRVVGTSRSSPPLLPNTLLLPHTAVAVHLRSADVLLLVLVLHPAGDVRGVPPAREALRLGGMSLRAPLPLLLAPLAEGQGDGADAAGLAAGPGVVAAGGASGGVAGGRDDGLLVVVVAVGVPAGGDVDDC